MSKREYYREGHDHGYVGVVRHTRGTHVPELEAGSPLVVEDHVHHAVCGRLLYDLHVQPPAHILVWHEHGVVAGNVRMFSVKSSASNSLKEKA